MLKSKNDVYLAFKNITATFSMVKKYPRETVKAIVRIQGKESEPFDMSRGVTHSGSLSLLSFVKFINKVGNKFNEGNKHQIYYWKLQPIHRLIFSALMIWCHLQILQINCKELLIEYAENSNQPI